MPDRVGPRPGSVVAAELLKLRTLPAVIATVIATVVLSGLLTLAVSTGDAAATPAFAAVAQVTAYSQVGIVLVGILAATSEYDDRQIVTSLLSVPDRVRLAGAKAVACAVVVIGTAVLTVAAAYVAVVNRLDEIPWPDIATGAAGTIFYLTLLALFGHGIGLLLRGTTPALITILLLAYVASPLLGSVGDYLPGQVGSQLYQADPVIGLSAAVLVAWTTAALATAATVFQRRDAG